MTKIYAEGINDAWLKVIKELNDNGKEYSPRGLKINEILNMSVVIDNPKKRVLTLPVRKASLPYMFGEFLWYMEARNDLATMKYYSSIMDRFSDDGKTLNSAYGYRMFGRHPMLPFDQWQFVVDKLREDPDSRQAVIHLHTPNNRPTKDEVCTLGFQFFIRDGKLDMTANMRSNDIVWGFTYDVFNFTSFQELIANELGVEVGTYTHNAASMHIYEKDYMYLDIVGQIFDELLYATKYDSEFDYDGLTRHHRDLVEIVTLEGEYRLLGAAEEDIITENRALRTFADVFKFYSQYKRCGREKVFPQLKYDDVYHNMMRNYISGKKLNESSLMIFEGCDGAGKTTYINNLDLEADDQIVHFAKPNNFDKANYFMYATMSGDIILDRFIYSEWVYSRILGRPCMLTPYDMDVIEKLLVFRGAELYLVDTDYETCYERMSDDDKEIFSKDMVRRICESYKTAYNTTDWVSV